MCYKLKGDKIRRCFAPLALMFGSYRMSPVLRPSNAAVALAARGVGSAKRRAKSAVGFRNPETQILRPKP